MNILYIAPLDYVHDIKWMSYFSKDKSNKVFVITEKDAFERVDQQTREGLEASNIQLLPPLANFSARRFTETFKSIRILRKHIRTHHIDIVHALFACPQALWLSFLHTPSLITTRGSDALLVLPSLLNSSGIKGLHNRILFSLFKRSFAKAAYITSTSLAQMTALQETFGIREKLHLIRSGIDTGMVSEASSDHLPAQLRGKTYVFSPRFMSPVYNIQLQAQAIGLLPAELLSRCTFVFIKSHFSDPVYANTVLKMLDSIPGLDFVILDLLSPREMYAAFKHAALTLITPLSDGTPNTALEAMAAKSPLILGACRYDPELFGNTCLKLNSNDPGDLATLIRQALTDYPASLLDKAYQTVMQQGDREKEMQKLNTLYKTLRSNPNQPG